jgi:DnaJ-class molecular chaperone
MAPQTYVNHSSDGQTTTYEGQCQPCGGSGLVDANADPHGLVWVNQRVSCKPCKGRGRVRVYPFAVARW